jgi:hypothetical protein
MGHARFSVRKNQIKSNLINLSVDIATKHNPQRWIFYLPSCALCYILRILGTRCLPTGANASNGTAICIATGESQLHFAKAVASARLLLAMKNSKLPENCGSIPRPVF